MADIEKVLLDDHRRIRRLFASYRAQPNNAEMALGICDELRIHASLEEELVLPVIQGANPGLAKETSADHADIEKLVARVERLEIGTRDFRTTMTSLEDATEAHIESIRKNLLPVLMSTLGPEAYALGKQAFGLRRDLQAELPEGRDVKTWKSLPNAGWGPSKVPNAGW